MYEEKVFSNECKFFKCQSSDVLGAGLTPPMRKWGRWLRRPAAALPHTTQHFKRDRRGVKLKRGGGGV